MRTRWLACLLLALGTPVFPAEPATPASAPLALDDLFSEQGAVDGAVSPSGRYLAVIVRLVDGDVLVLFDVTNGERKVLTKVDRKMVGARYDAFMTTIYWKSEELMLFRLAVHHAKDVNIKGMSNGDLRRLGNRLFSIDRAGKSVTRMLAQNRNSELEFALDLGDILTLLRNDPDHILMVVDGYDGRSLFKVNVRTGLGEVVVHADPDVVDWWLDLEGTPVVQVEESRGYRRFYRRENGKRWKQYYKARMHDLPDQEDDYEPIGPSDQDGKFYVLGRPEGAQRRGVYLYDLTKESFGAVVAENPEYDIYTAFVAIDGSRVMRYCYVADVYLCETADTKLNEHLKWLRAFFKDSVSVNVIDSSDGNQTLLLYVEGPSEPPSYYWYRLSDRTIRRVGLVQEAMSNKQLPTAKAVHYQGRDGTRLSGYLTLPPGADNATQLPLVMYPHGGPEARDSLTFDLWVQYFAAQGYAVFQPNFRGSEGFGKAFTESGYGEWGRKMQDDISDAVATLVDKKIADPNRICIVGASYGGYAALAGATLTPDLYKCVVSVAGIADLRHFLFTRRNRHGIDSELYAYWKAQIGDPETQAERIAAVSPALHVDAIKAPILLVHGDADDIVLYEQSKDMKKLLDKSGRPTQLIKLEDEGHSGWSDENERLVLNAIGEFLQARIGPGYSTHPGTDHEKTQQ